MRPAAMHTILIHFLHLYLDIDFSKLVARLLNCIYFCEFIEVCFQLDKARILHLRVCCRAASDNDYLGNYINDDSK